VTGYKLYNWSSISGTSRDFSLYYHIQIGHVAHPAFYPPDAEHTFPRAQQPESEADHSPPSSAEVKNTWGFIYTPA
jgi:hypothetical protein